jgi:hypothetical protein
MCRTDCPIVHLGSRHRKRCSPERSQRDVTFDEDAALKKSKLCQLEEVYEKEPVIPNTAIREVPRAAERVREVVTSPDEELLEDHDIVEVQEPPQMTILHKRASLG